MRFLIALVTFAGVVSAQNPGATNPPVDETLTLETLFSPRDLGALEQLVATAQANNPDVAEAQSTLTLNAADTELLGRLSRSLGGKQRRRRPLNRQRRGDRLARGARRDCRHGGEAGCSGNDPGQDAVKVMFVFRSRGVWHASKPGESLWLDLFDSDTLPTPYRAETPQDEVVAELSVRNPGFDIIVVADE